MSATRAVLLDALGTLVALEPPAPRLRAALRELAGIDVGERAAAHAFGAEIAYYTEHHLEGGDAHGLERLRDDCAAVMRDALAEPRLDHGVVRAAMLSSLEFTPFPDVVPALTALRERGMRLVVASNWDCSLGDRLAEAGLGHLVDGAVSSAEAGGAKPAPAVFLAALEAAGAEPGEAMHVGDSAVNDVEGARAAGIRPVLIARGADVPAGVTAVRSLEELPSLL